jgi:D-alanyl-D-alanine carboxypeptidase
MNEITRPKRRRLRTIVAVSSAVALVAGAVTAGAWIRTSQEPDDAGTALESRMQSLVDAGYPAALASVTHADDRRADVAVGAGDVTTGAEPPEDGEVRVASNTKMFVATVVLQLVEEGALALDAPIDDYLPGLVRGDGIDGARITTRQLLQHTAGLPEYVDQVAADAFGAQHRYTSPSDLLAAALTRPASFAPGESWAYSNTNYVVLGLVIEAVTERALGQQLEERVIRPLGLEHTYFPAPGEWELRGEHPRGYHAETAGDLRDITDLDTSFAWAAGALVSTPSELNTFMTALLDGTLLGDDGLAQMQTTVPAGDELTPGAGYGLGLQSYPLSCGGVAWGHGGDIPGTQTRNAVGPDGTAVTIAVTALPWAVVPADDEAVLLDQYRIVIDALDATLCDD